MHFKVGCSRSDPDLVSWSSVSLDLLAHQHRTASSTAPAAETAASDAEQASGKSSDEEPGESEFSMVKPTSAVLFTSGAVSESSSKHAREESTSSQQLSQYRRSKCLALQCDLC